MTNVTFPAPEPHPTCNACLTKRAEVTNLKGELDRRKAYSETTEARLRELETDLIACREATSGGRQEETIKKLQRVDLTQRRDLDLAYDKISEQRQEIERLLKLCKSNKVATEKPGVPDASPVKPAAGWGAFTGSQGVGN